MSARTNPRVVAIGASAGGISALQSVIAALPSDLGAAFVVLQHLPPGRPSELPGLISRWTPMPVCVPAEGALPQPNTIYIPSPDDVLTLEEGMFRLRPAAGGRRRPGIDTIDAFVESLAEDQGSSAVAVVLSGTGMDGCAGAARVRQEGGTVFVQDPVTASFREMPMAVVSRSLADYVLPPSEMPEQLARCLNPSDDGPPVSRGSEVKQSLDTILDFVRKQAGFDLRGYRPSPLLWRIQQRMDVRRVRTFDDYLALLQDSPAELETLVRRIPIHITEFFRDPETWDVLNREVLEPMAGAASEIRTWTPACATGEEAYSIAMLLAEQAEKRNGLSYQVFATDASPEIVARASRGVFSPDAVRSLSSDRQARFFYSADGAFRVKRDLRQSMIFAPQDLLSDPPLSAIDLVTCRNLLIYLEPDASRRAVYLLHSALRTGGYLLLGRGETLPRSQEGFEAVSFLQNIYRKTGPISNVEVSFPTHIKTQRHLTAAAANAHRALIEHFEVPSALIDTDFQILRLYGNTGSILRLPEGEPTYDLLKLAPPGLTGYLRLVVADALAREAEVTMHGVGDPATGELSMNIQVTPVQAEEGGPSRLLVSFIRSTANSGAAANWTPIADVSLVPDTREWHSAARLSHQELEASREELATLNEELKTSNEQLSASYASLNQSNAELQGKIVELEMQSRVLSSGEVITLFLDAELTVRWFTPAICDLFPLRSQDIGRPITDIVQKFDQEDFIDIVRSVIRTGERHEAEVRTKDGRWFLKRIHPFFSGVQTTNGVAITFNDITQRKEVEEPLTERELWLAGIREALASVLSEAGLETALNVLVRTVEAVLGPGTTSTVFYVAKEDGTKLYRAAGMVDDYTQPVDGFQIGPQYQACGSGGHANVPVVTADGIEDPVWEPWRRRMAEKFDCRGCSSFPLRTTTGRFVGVLAVYSEQPHPATPRERAVSDVVIETAALIIEHYNVQQALRKTEARVAADLADSRLLQRTSSILIPDGNIDLLFREILDAARNLMRSDMASLQRFVPERNELRLLAQHGFAPESAQFWEWVTTNSTTSCALAFAQGKPLIVSDVENWDFVVGTKDLEHFRLSGIRAILSIPLLSRDGRPVGVISTHWQKAHEPSERELGLLDVLARQAADLIERSAATAALCESESRQTSLLKLSDALRPLSDATEIKAAACRFLGEETDVSRVFYADAVNEYWAVTKGYEERIQPLPEVPFSMATYGQWIIQDFLAGRRLVVRDMQTDPRFTEAERAAQLALQINAALAVPLVKDGALVAMLALHNGTPRDWRQSEITLVDETAERTWAAVERARAEAARREIEVRLAAAFDAVPPASPSSTRKEA